MLALELVLEQEVVPVQVVSEQVEEEVVEVSGKQKEVDVEDHCTLVVVSREVVHAFQDVVSDLDAPMAQSVVPVVAFQWEVELEVVDQDEEVTEVVELVLAAPEMQGEPCLEVQDVEVLAKVAAHEVVVHQEGMEEVQVGGLCLVLHLLLPLVFLQLEALEGVVILEAILVVRLLVVAQEEGMSLVAEFLVVEALV